jgi:HD-GYP domain-containing protein (c-di-GMP phosphodiesterase class II)
MVSTRLKILLIAAALGLLALIAHVVHLLVNAATPFRQEQVVVLMFATFLAILTELKPTRFYFGREASEITLTSIVFLPVMILYGWPIALLILVFAGVTTDVQAGKAWYKTMYNAFNGALCIYLAGQVYTILIGGKPFADALPWGIGAAIVAGIVFAAANTTLVAVAISVAQGSSFATVWRSHTAAIAPFAAAVVGLAVTAVLLWHFHPLAVLLLIAPMVAAKLSIENYVRLRTETDNFIHALADAVDLRDPYTSEHSQRVAELATALGRRLGISSHDLHDLEVIARVHDVGKIAVRDSVLQKPGKLTAEEFGQMQVHVEAGVRILEHISLYRQSLDILHQHHERLDGSGYPQGLKGDEILYTARILAVADAYDAMTTDRPYRPAQTPEATVRELYSFAGKQHDLSVVRALEDELIGRRVLRGPVLPGAIEQPAAEPAETTYEAGRVVPISRAGRRTSLPS